MVLKIAIEDVRCSWWMFSDNISSFGDVEIKMVGGKDVGWCCKGVVVLR